ncbi:hypothetical protein [Novosphingobium pentaromativorans]|uniref:CD-NTase-associated protein 12/Pycsar effector protein TIR domain-containing protein n=1 Tax=Novosphingobium pentaromativorans US6-1 TaxID=1088721 RepID=G6EDC6_9SPHN|nr:hypothetical protein [Novosphingobium pentaromativorans]AIT79789.1 hypothetical protein JI59_08350 [Novosphingobium pentaromativorans US6-1]EHJ60725.1 hypothetical protein NSU_2347 [Novosphingobium pentaromativorans US6-1]
MSTIFWSWQSDLDPRVTRNIVRDALALAIEDLDAELEERHELTSDTKGVAGSPDIVSTILAKIEAAKVFVGDVTPIAVAANGKAIANPNVLIELGYAKRAIGLERVITVWNTAYPGATIEQLPFDMRGRRGPMSFHLPEGAPSADLRTERDKLRSALREALRASIAVATPALPEPSSPAWQYAHPADPALWFDPATPLTINEDGAPGTKVLTEGPYGYVRIRPRHWSAPRETVQDGVRPRIMGPTQGYSWGATKGGFIVYSGSLRASGERPLTNCVMQFRSTGELWGVDPFIADREDRALFFADALISHINDFIDENLPVLQRQGAKGPFDVMIGATGLEGLHWISDTRWGGKPVALEPSATAEFTLAGLGEDERLTELETAWGEIAAAFGVTQPPRSTLVQQIRGF